MKYEEFISKFKSQSSKLSSERQLVLAIDICKKLFFDYQQFYEKNNWGDPDILLDAISQAEKYSAERDASKAKIFLQKIMKVTPDSEDFGEASYAINACSAVYETLQFLIDGQAGHIYTIGICLTDTIDFKLQEDCDLSQEQIDHHPRMIHARSYLLEATR